MEIIIDEFIWDQNSEKGRVRLERKYYYGQCNYNQPVWESRHDHKQTKVGDSHEFSDQCRVKIVYEIGENTGAGRTKFYPEMIENVLILNEMTRKY